MSLLIKNGTIVTADEEYRADILIERETITAIGQALVSPGAEIVDATGGFILPGGVDNHTHFAVQFGTTHTRGFETTTAAAIGGTTTIVDFAPQPVGLTLHQAVRKHVTEHAQNKSAVDFAMHVIILDVTEGLFSEIPALPGIGVSTIKLFMNNKGTPYHMRDGILFRALLASKPAGVTVMVHAENGDLVDTFQRQSAAAGKLEPRHHAPCQPPFVEEEATVRALTLARAAGTPIFVVHVSTAQAMAAIRDCHNTGQPAFGETCPQYLVLSAELIDRPGPEGAKYLCNPPLRERHHQDALWGALERGWLQVVGTDHCGLDQTQKLSSPNDFRDIPPGLPGIDHRLNILWTYGVMTGRLSRRRLVDVYATAPARFNGLYPAKGTIAPGSDADIVIFDPNWRGIMTVNDSLQGVDYCIYEGMEQIGRPERVYLRGELLVDGGRFVGPAGWGRFVHARPFGAAYDGIR